MPACQGGLRGGCTSGSQGGPEAKQEQSRGRLCAEPGNPWGPGGGHSQLPSLSPSCLEDASPCDWAPEPSRKQSRVWLRDEGHRHSVWGDPRPQPRRARDEQQTASIVPPRALQPARSEGCLGRRPQPGNCGYPEASWEQSEDVPSSNSLCTGEGMCIVQQLKCRLSRRGSGPPRASSGSFHPSHTRVLGAPRRRADHGSGSGAVFPPASPGTCTRTCRVASILLRVSVRTGAAVEGLGSERRRARPFPRLPLWLNPERPGPDAAAHTAGLWRHLFLQPGGSLELPVPWGHGL